MRRGRTAWNGSGRASSLVGSPSDAASGARWDFADRMLTPGSRLPAAKAYLQQLREAEARQAGSGSDDEATRDAVGQRLQGDAMEVNAAHIALLSYFLLLYYLQFHTSHQKAADRGDDHRGNGHRQQSCLCSCVSSIISLTLAQNQHFCALMLPCYLFHDCTGRESRTHPGFNPQLRAKVLAVPCKAMSVKAPARQRRLKWCLLGVMVWHLGRAVSFVLQALGNLHRRIAGSLVIPPLAGTASSGRLIKCHRCDAGLAASR